MRVAIARALVTRPRLLLLDEPFEPWTRSLEHLDDQLLGLWKQVGVTVIMVTHSWPRRFTSVRPCVLSPSPGRLAETMNIELGPRSSDTRLTPEFSRMSPRSRGARARRG